LGGCNHGLNARWLPGSLTSPSSKNLASKSHAAILSKQASKAQNTVEANAAHRVSRMTASRSVLTNTALLVSARVNTICHIRQHLPCNVAH